MVLVKTGKRKPTSVSLFFYAGFYRYRSSEFLPHTYLLPFADCLSELAVGILGVLNCIQIK